MNRMSPRDALMYWLSAKIPNDQFLLYGFDTGQDDPNALREWVLRRAHDVDDLRLVVRDVPWDIDYPVWAPREVGDDQVVVHELPERVWEKCRDATAELLATGVDVRVSPWTLHLFPGVRGAPNAASETTLIAVLQVSHALADGQRAARIARALFGSQPPRLSGPLPTPPPPPILAVRGLLRMPGQIGRLVAASVRAYRAYRASETLTQQGALPPKQEGRELTDLNADPNGRHGIRLRAIPLSDLKCESATVTVVALTAISVALPRYLESRGSVVPECLGAEVTVAEPGKARSRNHFRNVSVDLFPDERDLARRTNRIANALDERRTRAEHPTITSQGDAMAVTPAPMIRAGVRRYSPSEVPETVAGNTVLTSVNRGPADLRFGAGDVLFTAGFPALSPVMGVTHGVYGIGDTVTISVHFSPDVMPNPDEYERLLRQAVNDVRTALR